MTRKKLSQTKIALVWACSFAWLVSLSGCFYGTIAWSPDGQWLAFLTQSGENATLFSPGWWARPDSATQGLVARSGSPDPTTYRLWLSQPTGSHCWRLAQSSSALSSPAWSPDGLKIAYLRWGTSADGKNHCEVLIQRGFDEPKSLASCKTSASSATPAGPESEVKRLGLATSALAPAWSPRGNYLAVPWLDPPGTAVIRASDGQVIANFANAFLASWSPDESRLALVLPGDREGYHVTAANFGPPAAAVATKHAAQAAIWEPTGQAFYAIAWQDQPVGKGVACATPSPLSR